MTYDILIPLLAAAVQSGTPILFATLGEMFCERSGVLNLGVEGMILVGALCGFLGSFVTGSPWLGVVCAGIGGSMAAAVHGLVCIELKGNQVVSGLALTIFGAGLANFLGTPYVGRAAPGFGRWEIPGLSDIPVAGPILFSHDALVYVSFVLAALFWVVLKRTRIGMAVDASGENPRAAAAAGLSVRGCRWAGVLVGGFMAGLGGGYLSLAYTHLWSNGLSAGRGWIAVALVIFAFWRPGRAVLGSYLFGGVMAFQLRLQASGTNLPSSLLLMLPYAMTVLVLLFSAMRGRDVSAPAALGVNQEPEG